MKENNQQDHETKKCGCDNNNICCCKHKGGSGCSDDKCKCRSHGSDTVDSKQSES